MNGPTPAFQAWMDKQKAQEKEPEPKPLPTFKMGQGPVPLVQFAPTVDDDGAKARLKKEGNIVDLYTKWFNPAKVGEVKERSCLVSCCNGSAHSHNDNNPTMDLAPQLNTAYCRGCEWRPDIVDLAAVAAGLTSPGSKCPEGSTGLAVMFGCQSAFADMQEGWTSDGQFRPEKILTADATYGDITEVEAPPRVVPSFDWRNLIPKDCGLYRHMELIAQSDVPEEFGIPLWMTVVSSMIGNRIKFPGRTMPYTCNFYTCLVAPPNTGKSIGVEMIEKILNEWMFARDLDEASTDGVEIISDISSGEILVEAMDYWTVENKNQIAPLAVPGQPVPPRPKFVPAKQDHVSTLVKFDELETMNAKISISNSTLGAKLNSAWTGFGTELVARTRGKAPVRVNRYHVNLITTTQNDKVKTYVTPEMIRSGFYSRWTFVYAEPKPIPDDDDYVDIRYVDNIRKDVIALRDYARTRVRNQSSMLYPTNEAKAEMKKFKQEYIIKYMENQKNSLFSDMFKRLDVIFVRLCMFYSFSLLEDQMSLTAVRLAEHHWLWHCGMAELVLDSMSDQHAEIADYIESAVIKRANSKNKDGEPNFMRHKEVLRYVKDKYKGQINDDGIERIISNMLRGGTIHKYDANTGKNKIGRPPAVRYVPND